ncbi:MAG: hypothetical protein JXB15_09220 [Anaerolineales bacterium]|nr:hypothetical protein [Anaerolineales bacterium]
MPTLNRRAKRLFRFFEKKPAIRREVIARRVGYPATGTGLDPAAQELNTEEQVATLALWCASRPMDEVLLLVSRQALEGSSGSLGETFYQALEQAVDGLQREGLDQAAADLLKAGAALAEMRQQQEWARKFQTRTLKQLEGSIRGQAYLKQRGW